MPKIKTHKATAKRFKITGRGKLRGANRAAVISVVKGPDAPNVRCDRDWKWNPWTYRASSVCWRNE